MDQLAPAVSSYDFHCDAHPNWIVSIVKSGRWPGVVTAFITMSDIRDEIDWECECLLFDFRHPSSKRTPRARSNTTQVQTNWFWQGVVSESNYLTMRPH